jgi:predicted DNA-binding transcriptional regulator AlpA
MHTPTQRAGTADSRASEPNPNELLDCRSVCELFGSIHPATLYRGIRNGRYPPPIHVGPNTSRWLRSECAAALQAMIAMRAAQ